MVRGAFATIPLLPIDINRTAEIVSSFRTSTALLTLIARKRKSRLARLLSRISCASSFAGTYLSSDKGVAKDEGPGRNADVLFSPPPLFVTLAAPVRVPLIYDVCLGEDRSNNLMVKHYYYNNLYNCYVTDDNLYDSVQYDRMALEWHVWYFFTISARFCLDLDRR